jgi:hypothetical protein
MKSIPRKYLFLFFTLVIVEVIVIIAVILHALFDTSVWPVIAPVIGFLSKWVIIISAIVVLLGIWCFFTGVKRGARGSLLNKLHDWASEGVIILAQYRDEKAVGDSRSGNFEGLLRMIDTLMTDSPGMFSDEFFDNTLRSRKKEVFTALKNIRKKARRKDKSAFEELSRLQHDLADMMFLTFESASSEISAPEK